MNSNDQNESHCKQQFIKRKIGFQCEYAREASTSSRIKKKQCTTAAQREKIAEASEQFLDDLRRMRNSIQTPRGKPLVVGQP